jgi:uncharacterized protein (DUF1778 family)
MTNDQCTYTAHVSEPEKVKRKEREMATANTEMQIRLKVEEKARIRQCANLSGVNVSQFVRDAALVETQHVLADRTQFTLSGARYNAFLNALGNSPKPNEALNKLLHTSAPWD